jgi:undecaprenyl-diphosphatase
MNIHFFKVILDILEAWSLHGGYVFLFLVSTLEAVPVIGSAVPGHTAVILAGFLSRIGVLNVWFVMLIATLGAIIGDMIGYYIGRTYGLRIIERYRGRFFLRDEYIDKARSLISKHTGKALIIGRFNPLTRPFMPLLDGASHGQVGKFWFYNIAGGIIWAVSSVSLGYAFGVGYHAAAQIFGKAVVIVTLVGVVAIWGYSFVNRHFHVFKKYELFILGLNLISFFGIIQMMQDAWATPSFMVNFDVWLSIFVGDYVTTPMLSLARLVTDVGGAAVTASIGLAVGIWFLYVQRWRSALIMLFSVGTTLLSVELIKALFMRDRPLNAVYLILNDPSFPSGHAALAAAFFAAIAYLYVPKIGSSVKREILLVGCVLAAFLIGLTRILLNLHWASDVIAGWSLGLFCATFSILLVRYVGAFVMNRRKE